MKPEAKSLLPYIWILVLFRSCRPWHSHTRSWESWYNWISSTLAQKLSYQKKNQSDSKWWTLWEKQMKNCRKSYCINTHPAVLVDLQQRLIHFISQWYPNIFQYWQQRSMCFYTQHFRILGKYGCIQQTLKSNKDRSNKTIASSPLKTRNL